MIFDFCHFQLEQKQAETVSRKHHSGPNQYAMERAMAGVRIDLPGEVWKPVIGFENQYEVSNFGRVWSIPAAHYRTGRILQPYVNRGGYLAVGLRRSQGDYRPENFTVHKIVAMTFHGPCPKGHQCAHLDGNRKNPRADNLAWVTSLENHRHKRIHGTQTSGFDHPPNKFSPADVLEIRRRYATGESGASIAADIRSSPETVRLIATGVSYSDFRPDTICQQRGRGFRKSRRRHLQDAGVTIDCRKRP